MKPSRRKTLKLKNSQCQHCKLANKCKRANIKDGRCADFKTIEPKEGKQR